MDSRSKCSIMALWAFISLFFPATMATAMEPTTMHRHRVLLDAFRCDESKCLSSGPEAIVNRTGQIGAGTLEEGSFDVKSSYDLHRFDCYYKPNSNDALLCAEGYTGYPIDTSLEPSRVIASPLFFFGAPVEQNYYTCCPPASEETADMDEASEPIRRCGDPLKVVLDSDDPMPCNGDDGRVFPRPMQKSMPFYPDTYMCCDEDVGSAKEKEEEDEVVPQVPDVSGCDESRCLGRSVGEFLPGYSCWGEGPDNLNPYACSDGYVGVEVENQHDQPPFFDEGQFLKYYTCCPPSYAADIKLAPRRHCSEPIDYQPGEDEIVCDDPTLQYPRRQNKNGHFWHNMRNPGVTTESYVCCDEEFQTEVELEGPESNVTEGNPLAISSASESFLDEVDCVMTCDPDFIYDCWAENKYGFLWPMGCDDPNGVFVEPILLGEGYAMAGTRFFHKYGCCKKGYGSGPFIQDKAFNQTVWPQLILSTLAVFASVLLISALMLSFFYGDTEGAANVPTTKINTSAISSTASENRGSSSGMLASLKRGVFRYRTSQASGRSSGGSRKKGKGNANGAYNAYLVYLAIPDFILNLFVVVLYGGYVNQKFYPGFTTYIVNSIFYDRRTAFDMALVLACSAANLYLNAIISYELFTLLKNSKRRLRTPPPTFRRVGLQAACVYAWSICIFLIRFFVESSKKMPAWLEITLYFVLSAGIPIVYLCYVCFVIWRRKLLPSMKGPLRVLALYFFRIIAVFILLWLPGVLLLSFACNWNWNNAAGNAYNDTLYPIGLIFCSIQPIFSTGMALTKPDVRAAFSRFLRFSYCRQEQQMEEENGASGNNGIKGDIEVSGTNKVPVSGTGMSKTSITNSSVINSSAE